MKNKLNRIFDSNSQIKENGTFFLPNFPTVGAPDFVILNEEKRREFGLSVREGMGKWKSKFKSNSNPKPFGAPS